MTKAETKAAKIAEYEALLARARTERTAENMDAAVKAGAELSVWIMENDPPKAARYASRAGQRQAAERRRR